MKTVDNFGLESAHSFEKAIAEVDEALFHDVNYAPPVAITQAVIDAAELTSRQFQIYSLHAEGCGSKVIADELGISTAAVRSSRPRAVSKVRNVLRAKGLIPDDGVPVPLHRRPVVIDERTSRAVRRHGL